MLGATHDAMSNFTNQVKFEMDKPVRVRVLAGWKRSSNVFYPTIDSQTGKTRIVSIMMPESGGTVFDDIAALDEAEQKRLVVESHGGMTPAAQEAIKKIRSKFRPNNKWNGLCFQRSKGAQVMILSIPYSAWQTCENIVVTPFTDSNGNTNTSLLQNGPTILYDLLIRKYREGRNSNVAFDTTWSVEPVDNKWVGKVPAEYAKPLVDITTDGKMKLISKSGKTVELDAVQSGIFVSEEISAINNMDDKLLDKTFIPATPAYIKDKLNNFPIFPKGLDKDGRSYYENSDLITGILKQIGHVNYIEAPKTAVSVPTGFPETKPPALGAGVMADPSVFTGGITPNTIL